jgi:hypothetical protein
MRRARHGLLVSLMPGRSTPTKISGETFLKILRSARSCARSYRTDHLKRRCHVAGFGTQKRAACRRRADSVCGRRDHAGGRPSGPSSHHGVAQDDSDGLPGPLRLAAPESDGGSDPRPAGRHSPASIRIRKDDLSSWERPASPPARAATSPRGSAPPATLGR